MSAIESDFSSLQLQIETVAQSEMSDVGATGGGVCVVADGRIILIKIFGNDGAGRPITPETVFPIGSVTKFFTAAAFVRLADETDLDINAPIGTFTSALHPTIQNLTAAQLLTHTAGLRDFGALPGEEIGNDTDFAAPLGSWDEDAFFTRPGEVFSYSNPGYALIGRLMEAVSGTTYARRVSERLLAPLELRDTHFLGDGTTSDFAPAGLLSSTLHDLGRFACASLSENSDLPLARLTERRLPIPSRVGEHYGFGCVVRQEHGVEIVEHVGAVDGFGCLLRMVPSKRFAVVAFVNQTAAHLPKTAEATMEICLSLSIAKKRESASLIKLDAAEMERYIGSYANAPRRAELFAKNGTLFFRRGNFVSPVVKIAENRLFAVLPVAGKTQEIEVLFGASGAAEYIYPLGSLRALKRIAAR